ncbi:MAG: T9SS type A sorting domain-containing protein, partial [Pedobacter sp.]|nr:T9SS type A sorting domain-containing protein [Chitinophagaceae bacterium]
DKGTAEASYSSVVSVTLSGTATASVNVYPNPVVGSQINLQTANFKAGKLSIYLYDNQGKQMGLEVVNYSGGSLSQTLFIAASIKAGTYQLVVTDGVSTINKSVFIVR